MAEHHYLPAVKRTTNLIQPPVPGSWVTVSRREIEALSQGLEVGEGARGRGTTSVPDVWARALLFHSAIRPKSEHPLHDALVEEWRGLLSLVALSEYYGLQLQLEPVTIDDRGGRFARALIELAPKSVNLEEGKDFEWLDVLLLRVDDITVGALSPLTLVYTGVRDLPSSLRLVEGGKLHPPSDATERRYVAQWVEKLRERFRSLLWTDEQNPDHQIVDDINTLLGSWLDSLRRSLGLSPTEPLEQPGVEFRIADPPTNTTWGAKLLDYGIYRELLRPAHIERSGAISDLLLKRGRAGNEVVVITSQLLARDVKIWRTLKSRDLGGIDDPEAAIGRYFPSESGDKIERQNLAEAHALWIRPEKYFLSDTLLASASEAPLIADSEVVVEQKDKRFILPFRPEILSFFSPQEISSRLNPRFEPIDGGFRFTFMLPLDSAVVDKIRVEKEYRYKEPQAGQGTVRRFEPPPVYIFPRYRTRHWRRYFVIVGDSAWFLEPVLEPGAGAVRETRHRGRASIHQLSGDGAFPEAIIIRDSGADVGIVFLQRAVERQGLIDGDHDMVIGVDFGTSNTNVFLLHPSRPQPQPWELGIARNLQAVFDSGSAAQLLSDTFLPTTDVKMPIATTLRVFDPTSATDVLLDYCVFFSNDSDAYRLPADVYTDIKWQDVTKAQQFLKALLVLILLEIVEVGAKKFKILYSFPRAFSETQQERFAQAWRSAIEELTTENSRIINLAFGTDPDTLKPQLLEIASECEGVAAGEFFASRDKNGDYARITILNPQDAAAIGQTAVCIDVGGGTADICLWHLDDHVLDASVLLAGRQIASWLSRSSTVRELLFTRPAALALQDVEGEPGAFAARLNQILRSEEDKIAKNLITHGAHPEIDRLKRLIAIEFGAIVYYTATLLIGVDRLLEGEISRQITDLGVNLHWGGNAAKMLSWIDYGRFAEDGPAANLLRAVLRNALSDGSINTPKHAVANKQSPKHKCEVAGGLIVWNNVRGLHESKRAARAIDDDMVGGRGKPSVSHARSDAVVYMGDTVITPGGSIEYDKPTRVSELFPAPGKTAVSDIAMDKLDRFVEIMNAIGLRSGLIAEGRQVRLTEELKLHLRRRIRGQFVTLASLAPEARVIEPVFILEVKALLDVLSQER